MLNPPTTEQSYWKIFQKAELRQVKLTVNETKSSYMTFSFLKVDSHTSYNSLLATKRTVRMLGIRLDEDL